MIESIAVHTTVYDEASGSEDFSCRQNTPKQKSKRFPTINLGLMYLTHLYFGHLVLAWLSVALIQTNNLNVLHCYFFSQWKLWGQKLKQKLTQKLKQEFKQKLKRNLKQKLKQKLKQQKLTQKLKKKLKYKLKQKLKQQKETEIETTEIVYTP